MAKPLVLSLDGQEVPVQIKKIEREKLYGSVEIEAFDENGNQCFLRVLASDGKTIIDKGGTALGVVNESGRSVDRKVLVPVSSDGEDIVPVPSSFAAPNPLSIATAEEYLSCLVKSVYMLEAAPGDADFEYLEANLAQNTIYKFDFSYRGGVEYDAAFVISNKEGLFMIVGTQAALKFVKLNQQVELDIVEEQEISADDIDFDLL
jgi:hypothetical protein